MTKIEKTALLKTFLNIASMAAIVVAIRVFIGLVGLEVFGITLVSVFLAYLIKLMYDAEVDKATILEKLNNKDEQ